MASLTLHPFGKTGSLPRTRSKPRVAVAGAYRNGNFGDDLMATITARWLHNLGVEHQLWGLCEPYHQDFGFDIRRSADSILAGADMLVWGGGGFLIPQRQSTFRRLFSHGWNERAADLLTSAVHRQIPTYAISVGGGDQDVAPRDFLPAKRSFLEKMRGMTVRNQSDLQIARPFNVPAQYFADMVWLTSTEFPMPPRDPGVRRIGIDVYFSNILAQRSLGLLPLLMRVTAARPDLEFILMDGTNRSVKSYRGLGLLITGGNVHRYQFQHLTADLRLLSSLDLLISSRLHTVVTALSYGVPAISVIGEGKTRVMLKQIERPQLVYGNDRLDELEALLTNPAALESFVEKFPYPDLPALQKSALGHRHRLAEFVAAEAK